MQMDFSDIPDPQEFTNIPSGTKVRVIITTAEENTNDSGVVAFNMQLNVVDEGPYKGRSIYTRDTLHHPESNQKEGCFKSEQIGKGNLKKLIQALQLNPMELDSQNPWQFLNKIVLITVGVSKSTNPDYPPRNNVWKYEAAPGASGQQTGPPASFTPAPLPSPPAAPVPQAPPAAPAPYQTPPVAPLPIAHQAPPAAPAPYQTPPRQVSPAPYVPSQVPYQPPVDPSNDIPF